MLYHPIFKNVFIVKNKQKPNNKIHEVQPQIMCYWIALSLIQVKVIYKSLFSVLISTYHPTFFWFWIVFRWGCKHVCSVCDALLSRTNLNTAKHYLISVLSSSSLTLWGILWKTERCQITIVTMRPIVIEIWCIISLCCEHSNKKLFLMSHTVHVNI